MVKYLVLFILGGLAGRFINLTEKKQKMVSKFQTFSVIFILFIMGINLGKNDELIKNLGGLGLKSLAFALSPMVFSVLFVSIYEKIFKKKEEKKC